MKVKPNFLKEFGISTVDSKETDTSFFCMKLVSFLNQEAEIATEEYGKLWHQRFQEAKDGLCAYRKMCPIYAKTKKNPVQLKLFHS